MTLTATGVAAHQPVRPAVSLRAGERRVLAACLFAYLLALLVNG